jgi:hypothetical protein
LTGTLVFGPDNDFNNIVSNKGTDSLLDYLPAITGLVFDGNVNLTSTYNTITTNNGNQLIFDKTPNLEILSIQNCSSLTEDIDLTMCSNIQQVDASGTSINVFIPDGSGLTRYELGSPTAISIINPTVLDPNNVDVGDYENLTSLVLKNIPNNKTFKMFGKILKSL